MKQGKISIGSEKTGKTSPNYEGPTSKLTVLGDDDRLLMLVSDNRGHLLRSFGDHVSTDQSCCGGTRGTYTILGQVVLMLWLIAVGFSKKHNLLPNMSNVTFDYTFTSFHFNTLKKKRTNDSLLHKEVCLLFDIYIYIYHMHLHIIVLIPVSQK